MENETQTNETTETQTTNTNWLQQESKKLDENKRDFEELPSLMLEENKVTTITINFDKEFEKWEDKENDTLKKIIPVMHDGIKKNFWLNVKNPLYAELITGGVKGQTEFKVMRTGTNKNTKYTIVKE